MTSRIKNFLGKVKTVLLYAYGIFLAIDIFVFVPYWSFNSEKVPEIIVDINEFILTISILLPLFIFGLCYGVCFIYDIARSFVAPNEDK